MTEENKAILKSDKKDKVLANVPTEFHTIEEMIAFGEKLVATGLTPLKKPEDVMAAILAGKEMGLGVMASVNNIYPINGRATSGVHIIQALLLKAGVTFKIINDYTPLYAYVDKSKAVYEEDEVRSRPDIFQIITSDTPGSEYDNTRTQVIRLAKSIDWKTTVSFSRKIRQIDNSFKDIELSISRKLSDFKSLLDKDNWKNHPKTMLFNRILAIGGRAIGDDVLLGLMLREEVDTNTIVSIEASTVDIAAEEVV